MLHPNLVMPSTGQIYFGMVGGGGGGGGEGFSWLVVANTSMQQNTGLVSKMAAMEVTTVQQFSIIVKNE